MKEFSGQRLFWIGGALQNILLQCTLACTQGQLFTGLPISFSIRTSSAEALRPMVDECIAIGLPVTGETISELVAELEKTNNSTWENYQWLMEKTKSIRNLMQREMKNNLFFYIPPERMRYLPPGDEVYIFSRRVSENFRSSDFDAIEASACLACGRATAGVFHLMRVLEIGLSALGKVFGVSLENTNWAPALEEIESKIRSMHKDQTWKANPQCKELQSFYAQSAASFGVMKDAWRNHTMHVRAKYTEDEASQIFDAVKSFMSKLSERLTE